jgi:hypothetical protein
VRVHVRHHLVHVLEVDERIRERKVAAKWIQQLVVLERRALQHSESTHVLSRRARFFSYADLESRSECLGKLIDVVILEVGVVHDGL